jgi:hypothetical protein
MRQLDTSCGTLRGICGTFGRGGVLLATVAALALASLAGCDTENCYEDNQAPAVPTGVASITGDGYVVVYWNPVYESDLAGYGVYRSNTESGRYTRIGEVARGEDTVFEDHGLTNSVTYYYAVDAFDHSGNESDLSYETVDDTPRPEGWDATLFSKEYRPLLSGIAILPEAYDALVVLPYNDADAQYYLGHDALGCLRIVPRQDSHGAWNRIQDYGYTTSPDELDVAPTGGWSMCADGVEVIAGHAYVLKTASGYYGKLRVQEMGNDAIIFYWAYQGKWGSTELAPVRDKASKRG